MQVNIILRTEAQGDEEALKWVLLAQNKTEFGRRVLAAHARALTATYSQLREGYGVDEVAHLVALGLGPALDGVSDLGMQPTETLGMVEDIAQAVIDLGLKEDFVVFLEKLEDQWHGGCNNYRTSTAGKPGPGGKR